MNRKRKAVIIVSAAIAFAGLAAVVTGNIIKKANANTPKVEIESLSESDIGRKVAVKLEWDDIVPLDDELYYYQIDYDVNDFIIIPIRGFNSIKVGSDFVSNDGGYITVNVNKTREGTATYIADTFDAMYKETVRKLQDYKKNGIPEGKNLTEEKLDQYIASFDFAISQEGYDINVRSVTPYEFEVTDSGYYNLLIFVGMCLAVPALLVLLYALLGIKISGKKLVIGTAALVLACAVLIAFILRKDITTMMSFKEYAPGIYMMRIDSDYKLDKLLADGSYGESSLASWASKNMLWNIPVNVDISEFACCSFACTTPEGNHIFGRNYDHLTTDPLIFYCEPKGGYASIGITDLGIVNMAGPSKTKEPGSLYGRAFLRVSPLLISEGINKAGLGVSMLTLDYKDMSQNTGKTGLYLPVASRAMLDKCATVDEAIALLKSYDIKTMAGRSFHLFITDKSGKSAVAEWVNNELVITETDAVTNFYMSDPDHKSCSRYDTIKERFNKTGKVMSYREAMTLLMDASQNYDDIKTQWSCVYDLDNFKFYLVPDMDTDHVYEITKDTFK
ncbi:MAG: linear amide C-N hydrolase [Saccharofermentans sp.]|nr:linear amide C-N hydrolase [Saccharofermentans sp.]